MIREGAFYQQRSKTDKSIKKYRQTRRPSKVRPSQGNESRNQQVLRMTGGTLEPAGKPENLRDKDEQTPAEIYKIFSKLKKV